MADISRGARHSRHAQSPASGQNWMQRNYASISDLSEQDAPSPIGVDPSVTGAFRRISANEGAQVENRNNIGQISANAAQRPLSYGSASSKRLSGKRRPQFERHTTHYQSNRKLFAAIGFVAFLIICVGLYLGHSILTMKVEKNQGTPAETQTLAADQSVDYHASTFSIKQVDGKNALVMATKDNPEGNKIFDIEGQPASLILYKGTILIPENVGDSWDVIAYTIGGGAEPSEVSDADGNAIKEKGSIKSVNLNGDKLTITDQDGKNTEISLA